MKNGLQIILVACLALVFSCDKVEELPDFDFNTTIVKSLPVSVSTTNEMTASVVLDATSDAEIKKYADKIKDYEITEIFFAIEN